MSEVTAAGRLLLRLEGFEGPLDLLLELARAQKVDLARISILALAEQYLAVIDGARAVRLELAADWLVMAAWLAWLKSRLLLPQGSAEAIEAEQGADALAARLAELEAMRAAALWLGGQPALGRDFFARGAPESFVAIDRSGFRFELAALLTAYLAAARRGSAAARYRPPRLNLWTVQEALARLGRLLGHLPDWSRLEQFLPEHPSEPEQWRAAMASTLLASLEMARGGSLRLRQERPFGPILLGGCSGRAQA
ncbi:MAG: segregation and condensation protein A [Acetobacteraceae bacterium]